MGMRAVCFLALVAVASPLFSQTSEFSVRRARNWSDNASEGWCAVKVWVDDEAEFALQGDRIRVFTARGQEARDVATECSGPLPANVTDFRFRGVDGRGDVRLIEEPSFRNRWTAVVRIRDTRSGGEEYHYRLEWMRGSAFGNNRPGGGGGGGGGNRGDGGGFFGTGGGSSGSNSNLGSNDASRMRTRDLRREIDRIFYDVTRRRPSNDQIDDYIDRVRFDRWTLDDIARDARRY